MKIHSDILTFRDIEDAVPDGCYLAVFNQPGFGWTRCYYEGSRSRRYGFRVRLSGSSKHTMDTRNLRDHDKAATWDEWGIFIAALFERDPDAVIGWYKTRENFIAYTMAERDRCAANRPDLNRTAPWLDA